MLIILEFEILFARGRIKKDAVANKTELQKASKRFNYQGASHLLLKRKRFVRGYLLNIKFSGKINILLVNIISTLIDLQTSIHSIRMLANKAQ